MKNIFNRTAAKVKRIGKGAGVGAVVTTAAVLWWSLPLALPLVIAGTIIGGSVAAKSGPKNG
jgi:hypothetical protein